MTTAFSISPELTIVSKANEAGVYSYRLDSGKKDLNRTLALNDIPSINFSDVPIEIKGFDKYLYFDSQVDVDAFTALVKATGFEPIDTSSYETKLVGPDVIILVTGVVNLVLSVENPQIINLCNPIYRVIPDKKGELFFIQDVRQDVLETWVEEGKQAFFNVDKPRILGANDSRKNPSSMLLIGLLGLLSILAVALIAVLAIGTATDPTTTTSKSFTAPTADSLLTVNSTHPAAAAYGGGFEGQEGHGSVEDFSRLQVEQTEAMLKRMGVDIQASKNQNLGCFTKEDS